MEKTKMVERVREAINEIRPYLQADGGDIAFIELTDEMIVKVQLQGACGGCPHMQVTLKQGVESTLKKIIPEIKSVESI
ncbi:MAG: NifU family protein [Bacteroidales bacterium]